MSSVVPSIAEVQAALTAPGEPFEIIDTTIRGIPTRVWKNAPTSLGAILAQSRGYGDLDFLVYEEEHWTFKTHHAAVAALARTLVDRHGVEKGDRVAVAMRNLPEWSVGFWAAVAAGAVVVPLNAWWTGTELAYGLRDSATKVLICDQERLDRLDPELDELGDLQVLVARADPGPLDPRVGSLAELLDDVPADLEIPPVDIDPDDDATIFYTSGTTGEPKGVLGTHRNICTNLMSLGFVNSRGALRGTRRAPAGQALAATCTCCRCPSSTPPAVIRCSSPTSPRGTSWC